MTKNGNYYQMPRPARVTAGAEVLKTLRLAL